MNRYAPFLILTLDCPFATLATTGTQGRHCYEIDIIDCLLVFILNVRNLILTMKPYDLSKSK